jgi:hypothetical protein
MITFRQSSVKERAEDMGRLFFLFVETAVVILAAGCAGCSGDIVLFCLDK